MSNNSAYLHDPTCHMQLSLWPMKTTAIATIVVHE